LPNTDWVLILELLATGTNNELEEHFTRALDYAKNFTEPVVWVVNFTRADNAISNPHWQSEEQLSSGLNVMHIWHSEDFKIVKLIFNRSSTYEKLEFS